MDQNFFVNLLAVSFFAIILYLHFKHDLSSNLPDSAFRGFENFGRIMDYYRSALRIIRENRWLVLFPLSVALITFIVKFFLLLYLRSQNPVFQQMEQGGVYSFFVEKETVFHYVEILLQTPMYLNYGYYNSITGSELFILAYLFVMFLFNFFLSILAEFTEKRNEKNILFLEKVFILGIFLIIPAGMLLLVAIDANQTAYIWLAATLCLTILGLTSLSVVTIIEGFILHNIKAILEGNPQPFKVIFNRSMTTLRPLFYLNLILTSLGYLPSIMKALYTVSLFLPHSHPFWQFTSRMSRISLYFSYVHSLVTVFTVCAPFILVTYGAGVIETFKINFRFIKDYLTKYIIIVGLGVLFLLIPAFLEIYLTVSFHPLSIYESVLGSIMVWMRISIAVLFYVSAFKFFLEQENLLPDSGVVDF